ncbi:hypothetical protein ACQPZX_37165 [Actinoplanes sp. CA-142083]|uniref:hypothetical protein n=1 Tax=Actinoplanes sp. CA-142083 TaxID=3239903 RepID=UPI003D8B1CFC
MKKQPRKAPAKKAKPTPEKPPSGWAQLSKATKALVALVGTTAVAAVVPGVLPYVSDHTLDLFRAPIADVRSEIGSSAEFLGQAATEVVTTEPENIVADPRFVPAGYAGTRLTLEGRRSAPVTVLDMSVEIVERLPPRRGTLIFVRSQGEGDNTVVDLDLDAPRPVPVAAGGGPYFTGKHITLGRGELWVIDVRSRTTGHEYAWRLHLRLRYRGADREVTVPPAGQPPFRMTAFVAPADYRQQFVWNDKGVLAGHDCAAEQAACAATELPPVKAGR